MCDFKGINNASQIGKMEEDQFWPYDFYSFISPDILQYLAEMETIFFAVLTSITLAMGKHLPLWAHVGHR